MSGNINFRFAGLKSLKQACFRLLMVLCATVMVTWSLPTPAQDQTPTNPNQQAPPPEAGGPTTDVGPYAIPKKKEEPPPPPPEKPKKIEGMPDYSIQVNVPLVEVPVMVTTKDGQFISSLHKDNFRIFEDGVQQTISNFNVSEAPITAVLLVEYAATNYAFMIDALQASYSFVQSLKKDDWVAVEYYDMKPQILVDFTQDKGALLGALNQLRIPGFSETNMFDALYDTLDRLDRIEGHKYIILVSTGFDSFSKLNLDQTIKKVKTTKDVTIFPVSIGWTLREWCEVNHCTGMTRGMGIPVSRMDYYQADNEMQTFARLTGGRFYQPRFQAEYPEIFHDIAGDIRNQYQIAYHPSNPKLDGSYRKLKVEVIAPDGGPLKVHDQKGKDVKYQVIAREGYTAKHTVD
ncbi:MAG TPA: VWA domain-containing protein [Terriglobales bacterium]|nr:VWA domain-containing protein [Terriglobales bacterium]HXY16230.1 VWA domain-containing protein [Terriglobales bacterium]